MRPIKISLSVLLVAAALYMGAWVVSLNSSVETRYECRGDIAHDQQSVPSSVFIKLERYRWWVHLWAKSDALLWLEIPNAGGDVFTDVRLEGDQFLIMPKGDEGMGAFSTLSKALSIKTPRGFFTGMCKKTDA